MEVLLAPPCRMQAWAMRSLGLVLCVLYLIALFGLVFLILPQYPSKQECRRVLRWWMIGTIPYFGLLTGLLILVKS